MTFATEYLETNILTATPHQLHLMVIDGAIRHSTAAEGALRSGDFAPARMQLTRANQFVAELIAGLDSARQPHVVDRLKSVFAYVQRTLAEAERKHDPQPVADALAVLRLHRRTWLALGEKLAQEAAEHCPRPHAGFSWTT
ncbi:MAG TPA: flagellar export chaperone FliS [Planctomycetaceae bacterium]|jgi:flagellar protein FliS|nr:flagellar export chaperone FliS [Planctomycetaceae bacterium]